MYTTRAFLRKLNPEVFERAAERIELEINDYSCFAVEMAASENGLMFEDRCNHLAAYKEFFAPKTDKEVNKHPFWDKDALTTRTNRRHKTERITALAMMAAIVRQAKAGK
jgi:hypothetical protein